MLCKQPCSRSVVVLRVERAPWRLRCRSTCIRSPLVSLFHSIERGYYESDDSGETFWDRDVWRVSRIQAYQCIRTILQSIQSNNGVFEKVIAVCSALPEMKSVLFSQGVNGVESIVVIVDDTMHLRSMRKSVMKLCRECRVR